MAVRYVFLSDLHFGEPNGILADPVGPGPHAELVLNDGCAGLVACLHDVARANPDGELLRVVLLGDIFELALAPVHVALEGFARFVGALFPEDGSSRIDPRIVFVPGNHDHALWTSTRDDLLALQLEVMHGRLEATAPVTDVFSLLSPNGDGEGTIRSSLLTRLLRNRFSHRQDLEVDVAYPNLGILAGDAALVAHHGHFMDEVYLLMSTLSRSVFGSPKIAEIGQLEADNGPWIDFIWSGLGREGNIASDLRRGYDMLQSDSGKILLASRLATALIRRPRIRFARRLLQRMLLAPLLRVLDSVEHTDVRRSLPTCASVPDEVLGYLDGPLAKAMAAELDARGLGRPGRYTFVYGHTHRPLAEMALLPRTGIAAAIYNTGGWVVDTQAPRPSTGGSALFVDENLDAVLVGLAAQVASPHLEPVSIRQADGAEPGALHRHLASLVERPDGPWRRAAAALGSAILRRRAEHGARLFGEIEQLHGIEKLALRTEHIWRLLLRRQVKSAKALKEIVADDSASFLRTPKLLRDRSPIALPPQDLPI